MRFSTIIVSGVLAALSVSAQNATSSSAVVSGTEAASPAQSSEAACLSACPATDAQCRNACIIQPTGLPNPIITCINNCVQGNGTAADNQAYENCQRNCRLSSAALVTSTPAPTGAATASGSAATATGSGATGSGSPSSGAVRASGTSTGGASAASGSSTSSGTAASTSKSAASSDNIRVGMTVVGVFGAFAAILAL